MTARHLAQRICRAANEGEGLSTSQQLMIEEELKALCKHWYTKPFTIHPQFRAIAEKQFEEAWAKENTL